MTFHQQGTAMIQSDRPNIITFVAGPSPGTAGSTGDPFIDAALEALASKQPDGNRIVRVSSVRDIDLELSALGPTQLKDRIRLQIIGHSLSGGLALGAFWIPAAEVQARAFRFPYYILDTNPAPLGLLSKHAGKISELMLVGCNIGSASSVGYPINGRTLTYTLAEVLRCTVLGADDVIAPNEFDDRGWYAPSAHRRSPKGWRWLEAAAPVWVEAAPRVWTESEVDPVPRRRAKVA
jgi:hypothetical protein